MRLTLTRTHYLADCTIGKLLIDGVDSGIYTLEDMVREPGVKISGETAIPAGTYKVIVDYSKRFERELPRLLNVPNFTGVRIHSGNRAVDTEGCILVGLSWDGSNFVGHSRDAMKKLFPILRAAKEEIEMTIL